MMKKAISFALIMLACSAQGIAISTTENQIAANSDTIVNTRSRVIGLTIANAAAITGSLVLLNEAWYKDHPRSHFRFHNDFPDWLQQDKLGHFFSGYQLARFSTATYLWAGLNNKSAAWAGAATGTLFLTTVEILDGFSLEWGASIPDFIANTLGTTLFLSQHLLWEQQKVQVKYSYSESGLAHLRPALLGSSLPERMLKDYNAHTFWLSLNVRAFFPEQRMIPPWLNIAIGHGANGMIGSLQNPSVVNDQTMPLLHRYRQWYLAPDIDFTRINTNSPFLRSFFWMLNTLKMPSPAIEYNSKSGLRFHWLFF